MCNRTLRHGEVLILVAHYIEEWENKQRLIQLEFVTKSIAGILAIYVWSTVYLFIATMCLFLALVVSHSVTTFKCHRDADCYTINTPWNAT